MLQELERRGYICIPEVARPIIKEQISINGDALPWKNREKYSELMLQHSVRDFIQYQNDKNALNLKEAGLTSKESVKMFLYEYLKIIQGCDGIVAPCFASSYKNINSGAVSVSSVWNGYCVTLASGSSFCMDYPTLYDGSWGYVFIDINGKQGPNILGRDAFYLAVFTDGVLDVEGADINCRTNGICGAEGASLKDVRGTADACKAGANSSAQSCFGQILNDNWEMNY